MNHFIQQKEELTLKMAGESKGSQESPIPVVETIYYMRAAEQISGLEEQISFMIQQEDLPFWISMLADRVKCAKEWMMLSDNDELQESDLSIFTELYHEVKKGWAPPLRKEGYVLMVSIYKMHSIIAALEIQSHVSLYADNRKYHSVACNYLKKLSELTKPHQDTFRRIDEVLHGRPRM